MCSNVYNNKCDIRDNNNPCRINAGSSPRGAKPDRPNESKSKWGHVPHVRGGKTQRNAGDARRIATKHITGETDRSGRTHGADITNVRTPLSRPNTVATLILNRKRKSRWKPFLTPRQCNTLVNNFTELRRAKTKFPDTRTLAIEKRDRLKNNSETAGWSTGVKQALMANEWRVMGQVRTPTTPSRKTAIWYQTRTRLYN